MVAILLLLIMTIMMISRNSKRAGKHLNTVLLRLLILEQVEQKGIKNRQYHWEQLFSNVTILNSVVGFMPQENRSSPC